MSETAPKGWRQVRLGDIAKLFNGKAGGTGGTWLRVFKTRHVYDGFLRLEDPAFVPDEKAASVPRDTYLRAGDTLTPNMAHGTIGRVAFVREAAADWTVDGQIMVLRPSDDSVIGRYIYDWMSRVESKRLLVSMEKGGAFDELRGQTHIYRADVASIPLLLPPLCEQEKIAAILSSVDDTIQATQSVIEQLGIIRKGLVAELLTRGVPGRHSKYKPTEIGDVPAEWEVGPLSAYCQGKGRYGANVPKRPHDPSLPRYVRITDISSTGELVSGDRASIEEAEAEPYILTDGDLLVARSGATVGKSYVYRPSDGRCAHAGYLIRFHPTRDRLRARFVGYVMQSDRYFGWVKETQRAQAQPNINATEYGNFLVQVPSVDEQDEICSILATVDERRFVEMATLSQLAALKAALMSVLLTGEIRVTPDKAAP